MKADNKTRSETTINLIFCAEGDLGLYSLVLCLASYHSPKNVPCVKKFLINSMQTSAIYNPMHYSKV